MPPSGPLLPLFPLPHMHACTHTQVVSKSSHCQNKECTGWCSGDDQAERLAQWCREEGVFWVEALCTARDMYGRNHKTSGMSVSPPPPPPPLPSLLPPLPPVLFFKKCCRSTISFLCLLSSHSFAPLLFSLSIPPSSPPFLLSSLPSLLSSLPSLPSLLPPTVYGTLKFTRK